MKKLILVLLFIPLVFSCSSNEDEELDAVEYINSVQGYWVKSKTRDIIGFCGNNPVNSTVVTFDDYYRFYIGDNLARIVYKTGRFCGYTKDDLGNITEYGVVSDYCVKEYDLSLIHI